MRAPLTSGWRQRTLQRGRWLAGTIAGEFVMFAASTMAFQLSRLAISLMVARWVGPDEFGVWNALNLLLLYGALASFGVANGMNRDVPLLMGKQQSADAEQLVMLSFWFVAGTTTLVALLVAGLALATVVTPAYRPALLWMGLLFLCWQLYQFFQLRLKSMIQFRLMSIQQLAFALLLPVIVLPLAYVWRVPGFVLGQAIVAGLLVLFIARITRFRPTFVWDGERLRALIKTGFPIMAAGLVYGLLMTADRWVILTFLDVEALGHYTLAILCVSVLGLLPSVIGQQMYPRMAFRYGQTRSKQALRPIILRQSLLATLVTVPVLIITYVALPFLVQHWLPEYVQGVGPARLLLIGLAFIPLSGGVANFLNTVDKQLYYLAVQLAALILNVCLNILLVRAGYGLLGVATGAALTYMLYTLGLVAVGSLVYRTVG